MKHLYLTIFLLLVVLSVTAESYKTVKVTGEYHMSSNDNVTISQAKIFAQEDAKKKALFEVCGQQISVFEQVESSTKTGEVFTSSTSSQVNGEIAEFNIIKESFDGNGDIFIFYCEAKVKVKRGVQPDPAFVANVFSLQDSYYEGDSLAFMVEPSKDCYLNIFVYEDNDKVNLLYPNKREPSMKLTEGVNVFFPTPKQKEGYVLYRIQDKDSEINKIVFVFTKDECVPMGFSHTDTTAIDVIKNKSRINNKYYNREELERWITSIPSDRKYVWGTTFEIKKKRR